MKRSLLHACSLALSASASHAGPLAPPSGAPAPTMKTLQQVEPRTPVGPDTTPGDAQSLYRITQPGSYYLTGNIVGVAGKNGIEIASGDVALDLSGFAVVGGPNTNSGIVCFAPLNNLVVRNGAVRDWTGDGVLLSFDLPGSGHLVERVIAQNNGGVGILTGRSAIVRDCVSVGGGSAIVVSTNSLVERSARAGRPRSASSPARLRRERVHLDAQSGYRHQCGCRLGRRRLHGVVQRGHGIRATGGAVVRDNSCLNNGEGSGERGIHAMGVGNAITGNSCSGTPWGSSRRAGRIASRATTSR